MKGAHNRRVIQRIYALTESSCRLSVRQLKDTIQLSLLQQSEYLRRFSLVFCQKVSNFLYNEIPGIRKRIYYRFKRRTV